MMPPEVTNETYATRVLEVDPHKAISKGRLITISLKIHLHHSVVASAYRTFAYMDINCSSN